MSLAGKKVGAYETVDMDGEEAAGCLQALQVSGVFMLPLMLNAATELNVFGIITRRGSGASVSATEIASEIPEESQPGLEMRLDRMLCLLASHSLLTCSIRPITEHGGGTGFERIYGLTPSSAYYLPGRSLAVTMPFNFHQANLQFWPQGKAAILEGNSQFEKVNGKTLFQYLSVDPTFNGIFNRGMAGLSSVIMEEVLNIYGGFEGLSSLVDVAGGVGMCINMVVSKYPSIRGINFDQPHVTRGAPSYAGIEHVGGDMFVSIPDAEAIMIKETLHDWNDECCTKILKNCYGALPEKGKVITINVLLPEASKFITQMDNCMMMMLESHERTLKQFEALCKASGFSEFRVTEKLAHSVWAVMEFHK